MTQTGFSVRALIVVTAALVGGCLENTEPESPHLPDETVIHSVPNRPFVFNGTASGSGFEVVVRSVGDCMFKPYPGWSYKLFDRYGLRTFSLLEADPEAPVTVLSIPVQGTPPFLFAGDAHGCSTTVGSATRGVMGGFRLQDKGYDVNSAIRELRTDPIVLAQGQRDVSVRWAPGELVWDLEGGWPVVQSGRTTFQGAVRVFYPDGTLWAEKRYGGGSDKGFQPLQYHPGNYTIEVEADVVALEDFSFRYAFAALELDAWPCRLGFEWAACA